MATKVSVIVPVYNSELYLEECLQSIVNQTFRDIEIIVVDDGSVDGSTEIIEKFQRRDSRIVSVRQENNGAGGARNTGLDMAQGEYVLFADSDDYLKEDCIEVLYRKAKGDYDIVFYSAEIVTNIPEHELYIHESKNRNWERDVYLNEAMSGRELFIKMVAQKRFMSLLQIQFFKREMLVRNRVRYTPKYVCEDFAFCFAAIICAEKVYSIADKLYFRRVHAESITAIRNPYKHFLGRFVAYVDVIKYMPLSVKDDELYYTLVQYAEQLLYNARVEWRRLSDKERSEVYFGDNIMYDILFQEIFVRDIPDYDMEQCCGKVAVFGAGGMGEHFLRTVGPEHVELFIDNRKTGQYCGKPVISLREYIDKYLDLPIVVATKYYKDITLQLKRNGIGNLTKYLVDLM